MPLLDRTLLLRYFRVLTLTLGSFIAFLLVFQLKELAELAVAGAKVSKLLFFVLLQIPSIFPIALPSASLLSALLLFMRLSSSQELTVLRASGLSIAAIFRPLLIASLLLSLSNFILISELETTAHLTSRHLLYEFTTKNPLVLLQQGRLPSMKNGFVHLEPKKTAKSAQNLIVALPSPNNSRLMLLFAKELSINHEELLAKKVTLITPLNDPESLLIENQEKSSGLALDAAGLIHPPHLKLAFDHLNFRQLLQSMKHLNPKATDYPRKINKARAEIFRRLSLSITPLSFTLLGAAFGIEIGRKKRITHLILLAFIAAFSLTSFFIAKELDHLWILSSTLFLFPHILASVLSINRLKQIEEGNDAAL